MHNFCIWLGLHNASKIRTLILKKNKKNKNKTQQNNNNNNNDKTRSPPLGKIFKSGFFYMSFVGCSHIALESKACTPPLSLTYRSTIL